MRMIKIYKSSKNEKATVCANNNCITVFGDTARIVNGIVITTVSLIALSLLVKALR